MATDAPDAVEKASYEALAAAISPPAQVFQHPPEAVDVRDGVVIIGEIEVDAEVLACKDDQDRQLTLTVRSVIQSHQRKPLLALQAAVDGALDGLAVTQAGWTLRFVAHSSDAVLTADDKGEYYVGLNRYTVFAFHAD
jgi:hypothetical protein